MIVNEYKYGIIGMARKCDIVLHNGDHLDIRYVRPDGVTVTLDVTVQGLVMLAQHVESQAALNIRPTKIDMHPPLF